MLLMSLMVGLFPTLPAFAQEETDPGHIISDADMTDTLAMSRPELDAFIAGRGSLASYRATDLDGAVRSAGDIVWNAAQRFSLNPQFLLAMLQREQSLVEDPSPSDDQLEWAMGYAVCDDCRKDDPGIRKYRGFAAQVHYAAQRIRESYLADLASAGATFTGIGPGKAAMIDGTLVFPQNDATAALYTYTPHLHGNLNLARIWQRWFTRDYPSGTLLQGPDGGYWLVQRGVRRAIVSRGALYSRFDPDKAVPATDAALARYGVGDPISRPDYSLLRSPRGTVYLLVGDVKRGFASQAAMRANGFNPEEVDEAGFDELALYAEGEPITESTAKLQGTLVQDSSTGGVFWLEDGVRRPVRSREILAARFAGVPIERRSPSALSAYPVGDPVPFPDGTLLKAHGSPDVFVISEGTRRPIADERSFLAFGWRWENVVATDERSVLIHPLGDSVDASVPPEEEPTVILASQ